MNPTNPTNPNNATNPTNTKNPLRVLQLGSPTGLYGAERWILALIKHLNAQKVESVVGVIKDEPDLESPLCQEAEKNGFKTHQFEAPGKINFSVIKQIRQFIVQERIDILHTHFYKTDIIGFWATRGTNCKIISTPHGWSKKMDFKLWCYEMMDRMTFPFLNAVAPLSEDLYCPLKKIPGLNGKLHFIRNGVDLSEIMQSNSVNGSLLEEKKTGNFIIGYIGQLIPRKGLDTLFKALANVNKISWKLFLIGDGPQKNELEELAEQLRLKENIYFKGFRQDRLDFLRGFDSFILPSRLEGIPRCLMESMAAGVPVIASDIPGCNDLVKDMETGLLFELDNPTDLADKIQKMLNSEALRTTITQNAEQYIKKHYSASRMAMEYETLFFQLSSIH